MADIFGMSMWVYAGLFFIESFTLYLYYYGWDRWKRAGPSGATGAWAAAQRLGHHGHVHRQRVAHLHDVPAREGHRRGLPGQVDLWNAIANATWMPINIHRLIANAVFGGRIVARLRRRIGSWRPRPTRSEPTTTGWGTSGTSSPSPRFIVLPFAGYWLGREIYEYNQQMGITMMGGFMSWLWIVQAILIGVLFLAANYYLWLGWGASRAPSASALYEVDAAGLWSAGSCGVRPTP